MFAVIFVALKDLRLLARDRFGLFWVTFFPLAMALFFGSIFSGSGSSSRALKIAVVQDERATSGQWFYDKLAQSSALNVTPMSMDSARALVTHGKLVAYVRYEDTTGREFSMFAGNKPHIEVGIDPSRRAEAGYLQGLVNQAYFSRLQQQMSDPATVKEMARGDQAMLDSAYGLTGDQRSFLKGLLSNLDGFMSTVDSTGKTDSTDSTGGDDYSPFGSPDIDYVDVAVATNFPRSSWEITFPQAIQWALIGCVAAFALSIVTERTRCTFLRLRLAPISRAHVLAGKGLACFVASSGVATILMLIGIVVFGVRIASPIALVIALLASAICFVGLMMLISVLGKTEQAVGGAGWAILLIMSMLGGGMVPLMMMPSWMATIGNVSPVKWSILALEGAVWRGFTMSEMMLPVGILLAVGIVTFSIGVTILMKTTD